MIHYPTIEQIDQYRTYDAISQSFLKQVIANSTKEYRETVPMLIGSYLDALLFLPQYADDLFQVGLVKRPSDTIKGFIDSLWNSLEETEINRDLEVWKDKLMFRIREAGYQPNWGDDAVWKSVIKDGQAYWEELVSSQGKSIITEEERDLCTQLSVLTLSSPISAKYFIDQKDIDIYYQLPLYWLSNGIPCKGLLDILIVEHQTKTIYIVDLKSTGIFNIEDWFRMASQKRYEFQLSFYKEGVIQNFSELCYKIECRWLVVPTNIQKFKPWIIPCTEQMLDGGKYGFYKTRGSVFIDKDLIGTSAKRYKGWNEALSIYKICNEQGLLDWDLDHFTHQGKLDNAKANEMFFI